MWASTPPATSSAAPWPTTATASAEHRWAGVSTGGECIGRRRVYRQAVGVSTGSGCTDRRRVYRREAGVSTTGQVYQQQGMHIDRRRAYQHQGRRIDDGAGTLMAGRQYRSTPGNVTGPTGCEVAFHPHAASLAPFLLQAYKLILELIY